MRDDSRNVGGTKFKVLAVDDQDDSSGGDSIALPPGFRSLADITLRPLEWIWEGLIPRGKLTLITGEPGVGKSLFALQVAAMVTRGRQCPLPSSQTHESVDDSLAEGGAVLLFSADDDPADTLRPRLQAAGADLARVFVMAECSDGRGKQPTRAGQLANDTQPDGMPRLLCETERGSEQPSIDEGGQSRNRPRRTDRAGFRIERDLQKLEAAVIAFRDGGIDVRLIVLDPIDCYMASADKSADLSELVARLVDLAARSGAGVLAVANSTSSRIGRTGYRSDTIGNLELANAARSVLMVVPDLERDNHRVVLPVKINLCRNQAGIGFSFLDGVVQWSSKPVPLTGDQYFIQVREKLRNPLIREEQSEIQRVTNWLRERLSKGTASSVSIRADAYENEIAYTTLRRAFRRLGCLATRVGIHGKWYWRLPGQALISTENQDDFPDALAEAAREDTF